MVASPGFMAVIFPFSLTVATLFLLVLNVGLLPLDVLAVSLKVSPCSREIDFLFREMLVLEMVMLQYAILLPDFTEILQLPAFLAMIRPLLSTEAIERLELEKLGMVKLEVIARRRNSCPIFMVREYADKMINGVLEAAEAGCAEILLEKNRDKTRQMASNGWILHRFTSFLFWNERAAVYRLRGNVDDSRLWLSGWFLC